MQKIVLIGGFGGSGKSTCTDLLWNKLDHAAVVQADYMFHIRPFEIDTQEGRDQIGRVKLKNSLALIDTFLEEKFPTIIVDGLVWSQAELEAVEEKYGETAEIYLVWLHASKEVRFKRAMQRMDPGDDTVWLDKVEKTIPYPWPFSTKIATASKIDVDGKDAETIVQEILECLS